MATLSVQYDAENLSYQLNFSSKLNTFDATYKIEIPADICYQTVRCVDGFVAGVIFAAMESGENLEVHQPMTLKGIQNLSQFIEAWGNLLPDTYKKIKIHAHTIVNPEPITTNDAISAFSGGVDACFSLLRNAESDWGDASFNIKYVLGVQGFDIPKEKFAEYEELMERVSPIYEQYGCKRLKVWTDIKDQSKQDWDMSHAAQLASCLHIFSEHFSAGLIGSSEPYCDFFGPWGSMPSTDFLLSSGQMDIVHDGAGYSRTEKVERIAKNQVVLDRVKVCYQKGFNDNCGVCEKCYRTRLNFLAVGVENPKCFNQPIDYNHIKKVKFNSTVRFTELKSILSYAQAHQAEGEWVSAVKYAVFKNYVLYHSPPKLWLRKMKYALKKK